VQVDRSRLEPWKGDYHTALADANAYREVADYAPVIKELMEAGNWTPEQARYALYQYAQGGQAGPPTGPQAGAPSLTADEMRAMFRETFTNEFLPEIRRQYGSSLDDRDERIRTQAQREAETTIARKQESDFMVNHLKDMGYQVFEKAKKGEAEKLSLFGGALYREFQHHLNQVLADQAPEQLTADNPHPRGSAEAQKFDQEQRQARADYFDRPTQEHLSAAAEQMKQWRDFDYKAAARVASAQEKIPGETLGAGPGAAQTKPDFESLSIEEQADEVMQGIDVSED